MSNDSCIKKLTLPRRLFEKAKALAAAQGEVVFQPHVLVDLLMKKLDYFDSLAVCISSIGEYQEFLTTLFSDETDHIMIFFTGANWERLLPVQTRYNISTSDVMRLVLGSYLYPSGKAAFPLPNLAEIFLTERTAYQYNVVLKEPVTNLLRHIEKSILPLNRETIIRAAHFYFESGFGEKKNIIDDELYRMDNKATGWSRMTICGSQAMKRYFLNEKAKTRKTLGIVMSHTLYSFLSDLEQGRQG
jgi:hypothetical protein